MQKPLIVRVETLLKDKCVLGDDMAIKGVSLSMLILILILESYFYRMKSMVMVVAVL